MDISYYIKLGYLGLFILALVSNAIPYSTIPYLVFIAPILSRLHGWNLVFSILALTIGAALGKIMVYFLGRFISRFKRVEKYLGELPTFTKKHLKATFITVLLVAALPLPDDVFYIPIGASRYNLLYFSIALFAGKLIITGLTAFYGVLMTLLLEEVANLPPIINIPLMIVMTLVLFIAIGKVNWVKVEEMYNEKGIISALQYAAWSFAEIIILKPIAKFKSLLFRK